jgi:hypothetical protein
MRSLLVSELYDQHDEVQVEAAEIEQDEVVNLKNACFSEDKCDSQHVSQSLYRSKIES